MKLHKQPWRKKKPSLYIQEVTVYKYFDIHIFCIVTENCHTHAQHTHTCICWRKQSGSHKPVCVQTRSESTVGWTSIILPLSCSISLCLYALVKPRPVWHHLQHKPLNPCSLQCRKGHEEHMEGLWSLLVQGTESQKNSGNFRELDFFQALLVLSLFLLTSWHMKLPFLLL